MIELNMISIRRALLSVTDKTGIVEFAQGLAELRVALLSTGGTAKLLRANAVEITEVSDYTGFPEMLDGRVKTLHPKIHGGILALRDNPQHIQTMTDHDIAPIDMVVVNLYAFADAVAKSSCSIETAVEHIDIGGPTLIRAAAKNFRYVAVVTDPQDYPAILQKLRAGNGSLEAKTSLGLAHKAFLLTHQYDGAIADYLGKQVQLKALG